MVVRFGQKYRQWNAAFDAGYAVAKGKHLVVMHDEDLTHPLKEVTAAASVTCHSPEQVVHTLNYVITGRLPLPPSGFVPMAQRMQS